MVSFFISLYLTMQKKSQIFQEVLSYFLGAVISTNIWSISSPNTMKTAPPVFILSISTVPQSTASEHLRCLQVKLQMMQWRQNHFMSNGEHWWLGSYNALLHKISKGFNLPWSCSTPWLQAEWNQNHHWCNQARSWKESNEQWNEKLIYLTIFNIYVIKSTKKYRH